MPSDLKQVFGVGCLFTVTPLTLFTEELILLINRKSFQKPPACLPIKNDYLLMQQVGYQCTPKASRLYQLGKEY